VLDTIRKGRRRQDPIDPHKYKYMYPVKMLAVRFDTYRRGCQDSVSEVCFDGLWHREERRVTMMRKDVQFHYDRDADVLYLSVNKPQKAKTIEIGEDFVLRLHPKSGQVIGMTIINFSKHFPQLRPGRSDLPTNGSFNAARLLEQALTVQLQ